MFTVLVLASSPQDQGPLRLGKEIKVIQNTRDSAPNREQFVVVAYTATTVDDLRSGMLNRCPTIVHFSGHGGGPRGLCFEDEHGNTHPVNGERLAKLFHLVQEDVKCVVLNACYSEDQAKAISEHIDFVIGMKDEIGDEAAIKFAQGFYEAIWAGRSFEMAFKFGCSAIDTAGIPEEHIPVILKSPRLGGQRLEYSEDTQRIENFILRFCNSTVDDRVKLTVGGESDRDSINESISTGPQKWTSASVLSIANDLAGFRAIRAVVRVGHEAIEHVFYLRSTSDSFLLDWPATMGLWPLPFVTYKALWPQEHLTVRVTAQLDDYFNYGYERGQFICLKLMHISGAWFHG
jgi:hypothetical protein